MFWDSTPRHSNCLCEKVKCSWCACMTLADLRIWENCNQRYVIHGLEGYSKVSETKETSRSEWGTSLPFDGGDYSGFLGIPVNFLLFCQGQVTSNNLRNFLNIYCKIEKFARHTILLGRPRKPAWANSFATPYLQERSGGVSSRCRP
jgi:hypothetical protein